MGIVEKRGSEAINAMWKSQSYESTQPPLSIWHQALALLYLQRLNRFAVLFLMYLVPIGLDGSTRWVSLHTDPETSGAYGLTGFEPVWKQSGVARFLVVGVRKGAVA